jgi:hypothetical protein
MRSAPRIADMLAAFKQRGVAPPEEYRETVETWAQMEARRIGDSILAMPKESRRSAIDVFCEPFRAIVEREIKWLYQLKRAQHEKRNSSIAG